MPFSARSECTQRPGPPEGYPAFADPRPVRGGAMQEFSEVRGITSRNSLHQILTTNVALGVWQKAECRSPHPDWYRGGAMREDIATLNFREFLFSTTFVNKGEKKARSC